ncbi:MAG: hypothetical protein CVV64_18930, partial [Candidatus Wallbacteria bacterium HGW-Wallbacteria-1]|jgi:MoaA/NifB/PqqE/SkfB family radical SAM enzyme
MEVLKSHKVTYHEIREDKHLLVFTDAGEWLIADSELLDFLLSFNGQTSTEKILEEIKDKERATAIEVIKFLKEKGILFSYPAEITSEKTPNKIFNITINLTNQCNLKCKWCYNRVSETNQEISPDLVIKNIQAFRKHLARDANLILLGGEPFLVPAAIEKYLCFSEKYFTQKLLLSTNGIIANPEILKILKNRQIELQVSLDGADSESNDSIRGAGTFDRVLGNIKKFVDADIYTMISMVYSSAGISDFENYLKLATELNVDEARFIPLRAVNKGTGFNHLLPNQYQAFKSLLTVLQRNPAFKKLLDRDYFSILYNVCSGKGTRKNCGLGYEVLFIDADGSVYPCPNLKYPEYNAGNLHDTDLMSLYLESPVFLNLRKNFLTKNYTKVSVRLYTLDTINWKAWGESKEQEPLV